MKTIGILLMCFLLAGCGAQPTLETVADEQILPAGASVQQVLLELPEEVAVPVMTTEETGQLYLCEGYTLTLHTTEAGDLNKTLIETTGYSAQELQLLCTEQGGEKRYECVWAAAGEPELQVGRLCLVDDGAYHYVLTAMADQSKAGQLRQTWNTIFDSFRLVDTPVDVNTGS